MKTYASAVKQSLIEAGFAVVKNERDDVWEVKDGPDVLLHSRSLADLLIKSARELGV